MAIFSKEKIALLVDNLQDALASWLKQKEASDSEPERDCRDAVQHFTLLLILYPAQLLALLLYHFWVESPERLFTIMESFSLVPGTPVQQLIFPRAKADPSTGYEPNRPRSPRGQNNPYRAAPQAAPVRPPGIPGDRVPFYSSLIYLDERIHRQVGQETAARRLYEVNQYNLYEERESALRRELEEIQFEEEISLQARQHMQHWEQEEAAAFTVRVQAAESNIAQAATYRLLLMEEEAIQHHQHLRQASHRQSTLIGPLYNKKPEFTQRNGTKNCTTTRLRKPRRSLYLRQKDSVLSTRCKSKQTNGRVLYEMSLNGEKMLSSRSDRKVSSERFN